MNISKKSKFVLKTLFVMFTVCLSLLIYRLYILQIKNNDLYITKQKNQVAGSLVIKAKRGLIFSADGKVLANNIKMKSVFVEPFKIQNKEETAILLAKMLNLDKQILKNKLSSASIFAWVKRFIDNDTYFKLKKLNIKGVGFRDEYKRYYAFSNELCHVVGFCDIDQNGIEGLERVYDFVLKGEDGKLNFCKDARRKGLVFDKSDKINPIKGGDVQLTIDLPIQIIVREELEKVLEERKAKYASAVVLEPKTGKILAMVSLPDFSLNSYSKATNTQRINHALIGPYEPGSTFKPLVMSAALQKGVVTSGEKIFCENGLFKYKHRKLHDHKSFGNLTIEEIIYKSSNIGMSKVGLKLGDDNLRDWVSRFGFGVKTGIELTCEDLGKVTSAKDWSYYTTTSVPMGHEISVTPLQLARAYAAIVNGGYLISPHLVDKYKDQNGKVVKNGLSKFKMRKKILSTEVCKKMVSMMIDVVEKGTGRRAQISGIEVGGKTGTAQKRNPDGTYSHNKFSASFVGFAPAYNAKFVVVVVVDEPQGAHYGGTVAAPAVKNIIERGLRYKAIKEIEN